MDYSTQFTREAIFRACKINTGGNFLIIAGVGSVTFRNDDYLPVFIFISSIICISSLILIVVGFLYRPNLPEKTQRRFDTISWVSTLTSSFFVGLLNVSVSEYFGFFSTPHLLSWVFSVSLIEALASYLYHKPNLFLANFVSLFGSSVIWMIYEGSLTAIIIAILISGYCPMIYLRVLELTKLKDRTVDLVKKTDERQKLLQTFIDLIPAQISWLDSNLNYIGFNKQFLHANAELDPNELVGKKIGHNVQDKKMTNTLEHFSASNHNKEIKEMEILIRDESRWHLCHFQKEKYQDKEEILVVAMDIHEQKLVEQELIEQRSIADQASKFASIGEMASGIAHEINNPLTIVQGTSEILINMVKKEKSTPELLIKYLTKIVDTNHRIVKIVQGMRDFSRDEKADPMTKDQIKHIVDSTLLLCHEKYKVSGVDLTSSIDTDNVNCLCHPQQISQILVNFLNNSYDAIINNKSEKIIRIYLEANDSYNILCVSDNGDGILDMEKIFTPYYTTKQPGQGTGIGLSTSQRIAKIHNGFIKAVRENNNTVFKLYLPKV